MLELLARVDRREKQLDKLLGPAKSPGSSTSVPASFREFAESPLFCGLKLSPLIAAIMDASQGVPVTTLDDDTCTGHFGCGVDSLPRTARRTIVVRAGGRGGKTSRLIAPKAIHAALTVPAPDMRPGESAFAFIVAPMRDLAQQTFSFVRGYIEESPALRAMLVGVPTADEIYLRRPDGKSACIKVVAAGRGGTQLRARTTVFAALDEAALFRDSASGTVNDEHVFGAIAPRIVEGGQCWVVSTPWTAGIGLIEKTISSDWGVHEHALCVVAPTRGLRPEWDPTGAITAAEMARDPDNYEREILAIPQTSGSSLFFDPPAVDAAIDPERPLTLAHIDAPDVAYGAGGDFAFRTDSSTIAIVARKGDHYELVDFDERRPERGAPLKPSDVVADFAEHLSDYAIHELMADSHYRDTIQEELAGHNMSAIPAPEGQGGKAQTYVFMRSLLREGRLKIPNHPRLVRQIRDVVAKPVPGGGLSISSPRKVGVSGHGDLVSALVLAVWRARYASTLGDSRASVIGTPRDRDEVRDRHVASSRFDSQRGW